MSLDRLLAEEELRGDLGVGLAVGDKLCHLEFARGQCLETGPVGPAGRDAQFAGAPAGGDLSGTYPNASIANGAVTPSKLAVVPAAIVTHSVAQTIGSGIAVLTFDTEELDSAGVHDNAANPSRLQGSSGYISSVLSNPTICERWSY